METNDLLSESAVLRGAAVYSFINLFLNCCAHVLPLSTASAELLQCEVTAVV